MGAVCSHIEIPWCEAMLFRPMPQKIVLGQLGATNPICPRRGEYLAEFIKGGGVLTRGRLMSFAPLENTSLVKTEFWIWLNL